MQTIDLVSVQSAEGLFHIVSIPNGNNTLVWYDCTRHDLSIDEVFGLCRWRGQNMTKIWRTSDAKVFMPVKPKVRNDDF